MHFTKSLDFCTTVRFVQKRKAKAKAKVQTIKGSQKTVLNKHEHRNPYENKHTLNTIIGSWKSVGKNTRKGGIAIRPESMT